MRSPVVGFLRSVGARLALYVLSVIIMIDDKKPKPKMDIIYQYDSNALHVSSSIPRRPCSGRQD